LVHGDLTIDGRQLGSEDDSVFVAFYKDGSVALMLEAKGSITQTQLVVTVNDPNTDTEKHELTAGDYFIIVRVNGAQSVFTPQVNWS
jgi:hypothetical protein